MEGLNKFLKLEQHQELYNIRDSFKSPEMKDLNTKVSDIYENNFYVINKVQFNLIKYWFEQNLTDYIDKLQDLIKEAWSSGVKKNYDYTPSPLE